MKIKIAKNGRRYKVLANGQVRFIKGKGKVKRKGISRPKYGRPKRAKMARKKTSRRSKSKSMLGITSQDMWKAVGSGSAGLVGGVMNQFLPQINGNIAAGAGGLLISYMGKGAIKQVGKGILIKSFGDILEENLVPMIAGKLNFGNNNSGGNGQTITVYG